MTTRLLLFRILPRVARVTGRTASASLLVLLAACHSSAPPTPSGPPNVILVTLDTLRPDHLGFYGFRHETAPFLASLARDSAVFRNAVSTSSWTAPATASLFTGLYPNHHGVVENVFVHRQAREALARGEDVVLSVPTIPPSIATLPERLHQLGYRTFGLAANPNICPEMGFARGFDRFGLQERADARLLLRETVTWGAEIDSASPAFLYLHFNDVHAPYTPRQPWYQPQGDPRDDLRAAYDSEISYLDRVLAAVYHRFATHRPTLFVVVSDHGEEFWEHGGLGHVFNLHGEVNRVLMMVHGGGVTPGDRWQNVSLVDVLPTLLTAAGSSPAKEVDGRDLHPLLAGSLAAADRASWLRRHLFAHRVGKAPARQQLWAVVAERWKLIDGRGRQELFDMVADPGETTPVNDDHPEVADALYRSLERFRAVSPRLTGTPGQLHLDPQLLDTLKSLGYVAD